MKWQGALSARRTDLRSAIILNDQVHETFHERQIFRAPNQRPAATTKTRIVVYNGAEENAPETVKYLEALFKVTATLKNDPSARVDIVITTAPATPNLTPPPAP